MEKIIEKDIIDELTEIKDQSSAIRLVDNEGNVLYYSTEALKDLPVINTYDEIPAESINSVNIYDSSSDLKRLYLKKEHISDRYYAVRSLPLYDGQNCIGAIEIYKDITSRRMLEKAINNQIGNVESDLDFAKTIQTKMLPNKGSYNNVIVDYIYRPSNHLSGDIFDIKAIGKDHLGIYMVDVSGHGIATSMMTVFIRQTMETLFEKYFSPSKILTEMQKKFLELDLEYNRYFTIFCGVYNIESKEFSYSNAGHNSIPFMYNDRQMMMLMTHGYPILSFEYNYSFEEKSMRVHSGDSLLFYTDGITEARNSKGEEFGKDRIKECILRNQENVMDCIIKKYNDFADIPQEDDIALLLLKIK